MPLPEKPAHMICDVCWTMVLVSIGLFLTESKYLSSLLELKEHGTAQCAGPCENKCKTGDVESEVGTWVFEAFSFIT